ncbi:MAG: hypothetical protein LQ346_006604 [Caloplaca aetnensis]|nr:MAG: hypothetical protein LQ346_006604 [Caloplaca aetnensis]
MALEIPWHYIDDFCKNPMEGDVPGLEVWGEDAKDWYSVPPVEGAYVVNMGNLFAQWTNHEYGSSAHRVIHRAPVDRYSIAFNYNGNRDFEIKCIDSCRKEC